MLQIYYEIYCDILMYCKPKKLTVQAKFLRRGGIDISPIRSSRPIDNKGIKRHIRQ